MKFKGLDLNLLVALNALLIEKNVSAAGRRVFLSQSAMSGALARLREHFRDELLVPHGRRMTLTSFGESMVEPVRRLMVEIEATIGAGAAFDPATSRRSFRVNASEYVIQIIMTSVAARAAREAPGVVLEFIRPPGTAPSAIEEGEIDLLVIPESYVSPLHAAELLSEEHYVVIGWNGNERLRRPLTVETFFELPHVEMRLGRTTSFAEAQVNRRPNARKVEVITSSFTAIPKLVVGTERIALVQDKLAESFARDFPIVILDAPFEILPLRVMIQHNVSGANDAGIQWLKSIIMEIAQEGGNYRASR